MNIHVDCYPCMLNNIVKMSRFLGLDEDDIYQIVKFTLKEMADTDREQTPPRIYRRVYDFLHNNFFSDQLVFDPYLDIKRWSNEIALSFSDALRKDVAEAQDPLLEALKVSAAGNIIDFGVKHFNRDQLKEEIEKIHSLSFHRIDIEAFRKQLEQAKTILFIGDNAGEIVFDRILIETMQNLSRNAEIVFACREKPILNDVTIDDAVEIGMDKVARVISSGSLYPGTIYNEGTEEFKKLFKSADIVMAKGQGNYETLCGMAPRDLFYILRIKCDVLSQDIGSPKHSLILLHSEFKKAFPE
ncbi:MAG: ARMT1-like domain-containing protein [Spirochaetales bacterium]|nr:ARMT1-like domain-containing protein [Spirochaetales bacterium]